LSNAPAGKGYINANYLSFSKNDVDN